MPPSTGAGGGAYDTSVPAPTSTYGAYDQGAYGASGGGGGAYGGADAYEPPTVSAYGAGGGGGGVGVTDDAATRARMRELEEKERELERKERDLAKREKELGSAGPVRNWPFKWYAIAYHNIDEEIPEGTR